MIVGASGTNKGQGRVGGGGVFLVASVKDIGANREAPPNTFAKTSPMG